MKIYQFTTLIPPVTNGEVNKVKKTANAANNDFAALLENVSQKKETDITGPSKIISQENHRALNLPSASEMSMAEKLLDFLNNDILSSSPEDLRNIHNLEGLVCVYSKNGPEN